MKNLDKVILGLYDNAIVDIDLYGRKLKLHPAVIVDSTKYYDKATLTKGGRQLAYYGISQVKGIARESEFMSLKKLKQPYKFDDAIIPDIIKSGYSYNRVYNEPTPIYKCIDEIKSVRRLGPCAYNNRDLEIVAINDQYLVVSSRSILDDHVAKNGLLPEGLLEGEFTAIYDTSSDKLGYIVPRQSVISKIINDDFQTTKDKLEIGDIYLIKNKPAIYLGMVDTYYNKNAHCSFVFKKPGIRKGNRANFSNMPFFVESMINKFLRSDLEPTRTTFSSVHKYYTAKKDAGNMSYLRDNTHSPKNNPSLFNIRITETIVKSPKKIGSLQLPTGIVSLVTKSLINQMRKDINSCDVRQQLGYRNKHYSNFDLTNYVIETYKHRVPLAEAGGEPDDILEFSEEYKLITSLA